MGKALDEILNYAWLNFEELPDVSGIENPLVARTDWEKENPHLHIFNVFRNPLYFPFTCKTLLNIDILPLQHVILTEFFDKTFPMIVASRGFGKTFLFGLYTILKCLLMPNSKVVIAGAAFRQSKMILENAERIWNGAPLLKSLCSAFSEAQGIRKDVDRWTLTIGHSSAIAIPIGNGSMIRGLRATDVIVDEFRSINEAIFEEVLAGFGAVSATPIENIKLRAKEAKLKKMGLMSEEEGYVIRNNKLIIGGTASYTFENYCKYWKRWKSIIESKGNLTRLKEIVGDIPDAFDWRDYSIMRMPYDLCPPGFMDDKQIANAKTRSSTSSFNLEFGAVFVGDSDGFFKRSLIETCVAYQGNPPPISINSEYVTFSAVTAGRPDKRYVYGIDPASERDNFAIIVLEVHPDHRRVVYSWTTRRAIFKDKSKKGQASEKDFFKYCARKILDLMKFFPTEHIGLDKQGGGVSIIEALQDEANLHGNEKVILPYAKYVDEDPFFWEEKDKETDNLPGHHFLHICQFANAEFTSQANHGLQKDLQSRSILFPHFDAISLELACKQATMVDGERVDTYDTLEDCMMEIEELKDELASIQYVITPGGRERWETPDEVKEGGKKGKQRKDRYSALVIANMIARVLPGLEKLKEVDYIGGYPSDLTKQFKDQLEVDDEYSHYVLIRR